MKKNNVIELIFCDMCHDRIKDNESRTKWEGSTYCDDCFEEYVELLEDKLIREDK